MGAKDMIGIRFHKLLVVSRKENNGSGSAMWECVCDCGQVRVIAGTALRAGRNKSCGCSSPRFVSLDGGNHGMTKSRTYKLWYGMIKRCSDSAKGKSKRLYYDKGIRVCEKWGNFENFYADMGDAPDGFSIDRIDGSGNYEPNNCRWANAKQQANNTTRNVRITHDGETKTIAEWADALGIKPNSLVYRFRRGIAVERALQSKITHMRTMQAEERRKDCPVCGKSFVPRISQLREGRGVYCSHACHGKFVAMRNSGIISAGWR